MSTTLHLRTESELASDEKFISIITRLQSEDLGRITKKMVQRNKITLEAANFYKDQFLRFFALVSYLDVSVAPSVGIDLFWHEFILHTKQYHEFCERNCGYYFHHEPFDDETPRSFIENTESGEKLIALHFAVSSLYANMGPSKCASP